MSEFPKRLQVEINKKNIVSLIKSAEEREIKPTQLVNSLLEKFFDSQQNPPQEKDEISDAISEINRKLNFLNASFTGTVLDLVESSFLIKEASFNTEEALKSALETREHYEQVFEKYSEFLEN